MSAQLLGYIDRPGPLHSLTGVSKLALVAGIIIAAMIGFDARFLVGLAALNVVIWVLSGIRLRDMAVVLWIIGTFMVLNNLLIFAFAPGYGAQLLATDGSGAGHVLLEGPGRWDLTAEQLFYQGLVTIKYVAVLPSVLLFIATTRPPEFAASLHRIGVPYQVAYAVSLALRYIPDVQREFRTISAAQQARGMDMSAGAPLRLRVRNLVGVLLPLLLSALDRIESVSSAMELRGFGRERSRTWSASRPLRGRDLVTIVLAVVLVMIAVALLVLNGGRYWNPFSP